MIDEQADRRDGRRLERIPGSRDVLRGSRTLARGLATRLLPPTAVFVLLLSTWHGVVVYYDVPAIVLPSPAEVGATLVETYPTLLGDAAVTAVTAGIGLVAGTVVGAGLAFAMISSRRAASTILPYVVALRIAPVIAIAPLLFLWFGRGVPARALVVTTLTVFPITIATLDGLRGTPESYLELLRTVDASSTAVFVHIRLPAAAPSVFAGLKIAATLSVIGAVVAEFVTLNAGLGYRVFETAAYLRTAETYAALVVLSVVGIGFYLVPVALERVLWY
ncbi:ABC transporter permease [Natronococcus sp. A-GB7]|uniref:ABC transporter permease n=1 Tax=Natronococcus sp. A-GB7 TaxID=3037649 RepID=UPI00241F3E63|nr:ABC transporter permease [Natronococcus sp. A-GB7]MDG5819236.1 ABC transporter permease [Natronococcus sp. A-GB7]